MKNVTDLESARKACPYCGAKPACPDFTCLRIKSVWHCESMDEWEIEFHETWQPRQRDPEG